MPQNEQQKIISTIKKLGPSVVSIVVKTHQDRVVLSPMGQFFYEHAEEPTETAGGSGFIVSEDGLIITNRHVVADQESSFAAILNDGEEFELEILVRDVINDIAILKIVAPTKKRFKAAKLSRKKSLDIGQKVIAIGNALGLYQNTASLGIISGLDRRVTATDAATGSTITLKGVIQTDAAINPGNSGGPLLDLDGNVLGVNFAEVMGAENIGFAIPIARAQKDLKDLKKHGRILQPFLGVRTIMLSKELQVRFNLPIDYGVMILRNHPLEQAIIPGSPAEIAGLQEGDIILEADGVKIQTEDVFTDAINGHKVNDIIQLTILRGTETHVIKARLTERI